MFTPQIQFRAATEADWPAVARLLAAGELPLAGAQQHLESFVLALQDQSVVGCAGIERYREIGLIRSVAVDPAYRGQGIANALTARILAAAREGGLRDLYLLTTTARDYFARRGFTEVPRAHAPAELEASEEMRGACPTSATLMRANDHTNASRIWGCRG